MSIYTQLKAIGVPMGSHESDLYVKDTPEGREIVATHEFFKSITRFRDQIDNEIWFCIPFAYDPWWEARRTQ